MRQLIHLGFLHECTLVANTGFLAPVSIFLVVFLSYTYIESWFSVDKASRPIRDTWNPAANGL